MSSFNAEFRVEDGQARQSIKELKKGIKGLTEAFEEAEIGGKDFIEAASGLSGLQKELKDARSEIVNIDKAYGDLNKALDSVGEAYNKAERNAAEYHANLLKLAKNQLKDQDRLRDKNFQAEVDDFDRRLKLASAAASKMSAQQRAIMEFRAGMGAKGAIPAIASPIRGTIEQGPLEASGGFPATAGSPAYREYIAKAAKESQDALKEVAATANEIAPSPKAFLPGSLAGYEAKLKRLKAEARLISPDTNRWQVLNKQILEAERGIAKINKRQSLGPTRGQRLGAAGGAFLYGGGMGGGFSSAAGGIAGGLMGGPAGAFTGAAIGQGIDTLAAGIGDMSKQAASLQQMQRGLAMASVDAKDFAKAQEAVAQMSNKLLMPLDQATKHFTQLRANTREYNLSVDETREILEGTSLAIMATGGSAEDLDGAMRAVVQIMSKGGVQAEELRGQLGERFPGAVVKFAKANKMSFEELQAALEAGEVGIREFVTFAKGNYEDYAKFSEQLATAPEYAGQRLAKAMQDISLEVGSLFGPMGAEIQDGFTNALQGITEFVRENRVVLGQMIKDFGEIIGPIAKVFVELLKIVGIFALEVGKVFTFLFDQIKSAIGMASIGEAKARLDKAKAATAGKTRPTPARENSIVEIVTGRGVLSETKDLLGIKNEFEELDAAQRRFNDLGGMAAYNEATKPLGLSNLTYGGLGAGMSIDRTGDEKEKNKKLQEFTNDRIKILKQRQEAENLNVDNQLLVSDREKELAKAAIDFRYGNLIIDEQLAQAEKDSLQYRVEDRGRFLAEMQTLADIERGAVKTKQQIAVAGPLMSEYQRLIDTQDELKLSLESVLSGQDELTESQKVAVLISKVLKGATAKQVAEVDKLTKAAMAAAAAVDKGRTVLAGATAIKELQDQIKLLGIINDDERRLAELRELYKNDEAIVQQVFNLEKIKEDIEKARALIGDFVSSTASDYKGFLKAVISGEDAVEALKQFQAGLKDKVLTIFLDFTMAPVEKFFKESLLGFLNPKVDPKLLEQEKSVNALTANTTELKNLTTAIKGMGAGTNATSSIQDPTAGNAFSDGSALPPIAPGFDAASVFGNPEALTGALGGVQASISESMNGIVSSFENGASSLGDALPAWDTALATNIPDTLKTATNDTNKATPTFQESLGKVTAGIGIAAGAIMGIAAGISQIKEGGTSNVLGGIGSVLMSLGGAVGGFAGLLKGANGGVAGGGWKPFPVTAFANGGMVNGPTLGLVGEGKYNEAIVPLPDGRSIPVQMKGGGGGLREAMNGSNGGASGSPILNMSFQSTNINGVEYVSRDQLEQAMVATRRQAASDGAKRGMSMTLDKLQQSPSTRSRLGMGGR
jgi:tape measure domain-containing protein